MSAAIESCEANCQYAMKPRIKHHSPTQIKMRILKGYGWFFASN